MEKIAIKIGLWEWVYGIGNIEMKKFCRYGSFDENDCRYGSVREGAMYEQSDDSGGRAWLHVCPFTIALIIMQKKSSNLCSYVCIIDC